MRLPLRTLCGNAPDQLPHGIRLRLAKIDPAKEIKKDRQRFLRRICKEDRNERNLVRSLNKLTQEGISEHLLEGSDAIFADQHHRRFDRCDLLSLLLKQRLSWSPAIEP